MSVLVVTSLGDIVVDLHTDRCPLTCKNFLKLCKIKYYNGCLFHNVQKDFTAQTGDPTGTGSGGDSIYKFLYGDQARFFSDEIHLDLKHLKMGTVAMASGGENLNASQFYITLRDDLDYLDGKHTVFGEVAEGLETLSRINDAYVDEKSRPYKNIRIKHTYILDDPFEDPPQLAELVPDASSSPEGKPKDEVDDEVRLEDDWVPMDEQLGAGELEEVLRAKEAHSRAVVLESIGDIPDAEIKPPDNVLFVCKLNPVTEDEDLHTIFSRFGTVTSAEIIRDFKTRGSLCYAFIEFDDKESCEEAYFKMDNALIDDRRIHVDFSQSVSKLWNQYRRKGNQAGNGGKGCFKCGSLDHIAKDCSGIGSPPKYTLKDDGFSRKGGNDSSRYGMVFGEDDGASPQRKKPRHQGVEQQKTSQRFLDEKRQNNYKQVDDRRKEHRQHASGRRKDYKKDELDYKTSRNDHRHGCNKRRDDAIRGGMRHTTGNNDDKRKGGKDGQRDELYSKKIGCQMRWGLIRRRGEVLKAAHDMMIRIGLGLGIKGTKHYILTPSPWHGGRKYLVVASKSCLAGYSTNIQSTRVKYYDSSILTSILNLRACLLASDQAIKFLLFGKRFEVLVIRVFVCVKRKFKKNSHPLIWGSEENL